MNEPLFERLSLHVEKYMVECRLDPTMYELTYSKDAHLRAIAIRLVREIARIEYDDRSALTVTAPLTWWQHLKLTLYQRYPRALRWAKKRWPVVFETTRYQARMFFPNVRVPRSPQFDMYFLDWKKLPDYTV